MHEQPTFLTVHHIFLVGLLFLLIVSGVYGPYLNDPLAGDDYEWLQHARSGLERPILLFTDLATFYRPFATWTWLAGYLIGKDAFWAYRITNLLLFWLCAVLLWRLMMHYRLGMISSICAVSIWLLAPYNTESVMSGSSRFDTSLLLFWLCLFLLWPSLSDGAKPTAGRFITLALLLFLAMMSKETWVVTPGFIFIMDYYIIKKSLKKSVMETGIISVPVLVYIIIYFSHFSAESKHYYQLSTSALRKIPAMISTFFEFAPHQAVGFNLGIPHFLALGLFLFLVVIITFRQSQLTGPLALSLGLIVLPQLPTLLSPYQPQRWLTIPYAGFILFLAIITNVLIKILSHKNHPLPFISAFLICLFALLGTAHYMRTKIEVATFHRINRLHKRLIDETSKIIPCFDESLPVVFIRMERTEPLTLIQRTDQGMEKPLFRRPDDPYALVEISALIDFAGIGKGIRAYPPSPPRPDTKRFFLLIHEPGRFLCRKIEQRPILEFLKVIESKGYRPKHFIIRKTG